MKQSSERFVMSWVGHDIVDELVRSRALTYGHIGLLHLLISRMDPMTGRVNMTANALAQHLGREAQPIRQMISALIRHQLITRWTDPSTGQRCILIHPSLASVGGQQRRGRLWQQFSEAVDGRHKHPVPAEVIERMYPIAAS